MNGVETLSSLTREYAHTVGCIGKKEAFVLKDIKISRDCYVPKENVKFYVAYESNAVREEVRKKRKEGKVYDFTNGKKILSVVYLKTDEMVLTNTLITTMTQRMNQEE